MPKPRYTQIAKGETPYVHVISRCVRRSFLCGVDDFSGRDYEHRRQWIVDEVMRLVDVFAIDVAAFAIMSNHYHLVLHINLKTAAHWSDDDVIDRWHQLFKEAIWTPMLIWSTCEPLAKSKPLKSRY